MDVGLQPSAVTTRPGSSKQSKSLHKRSKTDGKLDLYQTLKTQHATERTDKTELSQGKLSACFVMRRQSSVVNSNHTRSASLSINAKYKKDKSGKGIKTLFGENTFRTIRDVNQGEENSASRKIARFGNSEVFHKVIEESKCDLDDKPPTFTMRTLTSKSIMNATDKFIKKRQNLSKIFKEKKLITRNLNREPESTRGTYESLPTEEFMNHVQNEQMKASRHKRLQEKDKIQMSNFLKDPTLNSLLASHRDQEVHLNADKKLVYLSQLEIDEKRKYNLRRTFENFETQRKVDNIEEDIKSRVESRREPVCSSMH